MFDIGASELLLTVIVAIVVIGPKDLPRALRMAGSWLAKVRRVSGHFRSGIEEMIRQAELDEMEKKWREKNAEIMKETAADGTAAGLPAPASAESAVHMTPAAYPDYPDYPTSPVEEPVPAVGPGASLPDDNAASPELPLAQPKARP